MENKDFNIFDECAREMSNKTGKSINAAAFATTLTLGTFKGSSIVVDNFKYEITDYLFLDLSGSYKTEESEGHSHSFNIPTTINAGDRVLVAKIGAEFVIIGRVKHG